MITKCKGAAFAAAVAGTILTGMSAADAQIISLNGRWAGSDNLVLVIRGSDWFHPERGAATIRKGSNGASIDVYYHQYQGMRCQYRVHTAGGGDVLVLEAVDASQSRDFCPSGRFSRSD